MKNLAKNVGIVLALTILGKVASFLSEMIIANFLGTTNQADAYSMISGIHYVIYPMLGIGIWSIFLPEYQKRRVLAEEKELKEYSDKVITLFLILSTIAAVLVFVFAGQIISVASPGFSEETKEIATILLRIYSPYFVFSTISSVYAAMLQSRGRFLGSQIREFASYLPTILIGPLLYSKIGVSGFAVALIFGSILRLVVQFPFINWEYRYKPNFHFRDKSIATIFKKSPSALIISSSDQVLTLVDKSMASSLAIGSVASLNYGHKLTNVINGVVTTSVGTVLFPEMPKMLVKKQHKELGDLTVRVLVSLSMIIFPIMILALIYSKDIVQLVYARGLFDDNSVITTTAVFYGYLFGLYFVGIKQITDKLFYSMDKNNIVMIFNIIHVVMNIILNIILINMMGLSGLAYATSISSTVYMLICLVYLKRSIIRLNIFKLFGKLVIVFLISLLPTLAISMLLNNTGLFWVIRLIITAVAGLIFYLIVYKIIRFEEFINMQNMVLKIFKNKKN